MKHSEKPRNKRAQCDYNLDYPLPLIDLDCFGTAVYFEEKIA